MPSIPPKALSGIGIILMKRAFTLIELLVVIAIIAILAAILFPVFAQAKEAAKKTQGLSQMKQTTTGITIYTTDADDNLPLSIIPSAAGPLQFNLLAEVPVDWRINVAATNERHSVYWQNSCRPYIKSDQMYQHPSGVDQGTPPTTTLGRIPTRTGGTFNGLLSSLSMTSMAQPSAVTMLWFGHGKTNRVGQSLPVPALRCNTPVGQTCVFNPSGYPDSTNGSGNTFGSAWFVPTGTATHYAYNQGSIFVRADTSAKYLRLGSPNSTGNNMLVDPFASYDAAGRALSYTGCRPAGSAATVPFYWCFFRPDIER